MDQLKLILGLGLVLFLMFVREWFLWRRDKRFREEMMKVRDENERKSKLPPHW